MVAVSTRPCLTSFHNLRRDGTHIEALESRLEGMSGQPLAGIRYLAAVKSNEHHQQVTEQERPQVL
jgi:hypothetical protein